MQKKDKATLIQISTSDFIVDMHNTRQSWIDTAKGLLISLMVLGHLTIWMTDLGIQDPFHPYVCSVKIVYQCFFMQSFFIITGYCTNWNRNLGIFFFRNVKSLILPTCLIFFIVSVLIRVFKGCESPIIETLFDMKNWYKLGLPWFIPAMFIAKMVYWIIYRIPNIWYQLCCVMILYLVSLRVEQTTWIENYLFHRHALVCLPYLYVGNAIRKKSVNYEKWLLPLSISFLGLLSVQVCMEKWIGFIIPYQDAYIRLSLYDWPIHIVTALSGSALIFYIARRIKKNNCFESLGETSLLIYLMHGAVLCVTIIFLSRFISAEHDMISAVILYLLTYIFTMLFCKYFSMFVYHYKYISWIVGKW